MKAVLFTFLTLAAVFSNAEDGCPLGYQQHGTKCVLLLKNAVTWAEARVYCNSVGGQLLIVDNEVDNTEMKQYARNVTPMLQEASNRKCIWLAANDLLQQTKWRWDPHQEPVTYFDWYTKIEPNGILGEDCVVMWAPYQYQWADVHCEWHCSAICQTEGEVGQIVG